MSTETRQAALSRLRAAHDELEIVSEGTGLTISERNELTNATLAISNLIDSLIYPYERNEPITEASFPFVEDTQAGTVCVRLQRWGQVPECHRTIQAHSTAGRTG